MEKIIVIILSLFLTSFISVEDSGNNSEKITKLYIYKSTSHPNLRKVLYSVKLENMVAGDIINVQVQGQVSNRIGYNVMVASNLLLVNGSDDTKGIELNEASGTNIDPKIHHHKLMQNAIYKFTEDCSVCYVNYIVYAASIYAKSGDYLKVDQDYGRLQILIFK